MRADWILSRRQDFDFAGALADFGTPDLGGGIATASDSFGSGADLGGFASTALNTAGAAGAGSAGVAPGTGSFADTLGGFAKTALPFAQLGTAGLGAALGLRSADQASSAAKTAQQADKTRLQAAQAGLNIAQPLTAYGNQQLQRAASGQIPEAARSVIDQWKEAHKAEMVDYLARAGLGDSQSILLAKAQIDRMSDEMVLAEIEREQSLGLSAYQTATGAVGATSGAAGGVASSARADEQSLEQMIALADQQLARIAGSVKA